MTEAYDEMRTLEMEVNEEDILIPGLPPPPTNTPPQAMNTEPTTTNTTTEHQQEPIRRIGSAISNPQQRYQEANPQRRYHTNYAPRRCLIHLVVRCLICFQTPHHRNPRFFRQEGIRAIITLIREVFGANLNP